MVSSLDCIDPHTDFPLLVVGASRHSSPVVWTINLLALDKLHARSAEDAHII